MKLTPTDDPEVVKGENGHTYPSKYAPGMGDDTLDQAWLILDFIKPGTIPSDIRAFLSGMISGALHKERESNRVKYEERLRLLFAQGVSSNGSVDVVE